MLWQKIKDNNFSNKKLNNVVITGGGSGLGLATAKEFLRSGARVSIFDLENSNSEALKKN